jgi:hypothetical protein
LPFNVPQPHFQGVLILPELPQQYIGRLFLPAQLLTQLFNPEGFLLQQFLQTSNIDGFPLLIQPSANLTDWLKV